MWNEDNSPMNVPFVREAYRARQYAFVADYVRFWALYNHGGVYLDTDMFVVKSMDELLRHRCFIGQESPASGSLSGGVIGCQRGHGFVKTILDKYDALGFGLDRRDSLILPRLITPVYDEQKVKDGIVILPYDCFYPFPYKKKESKRSFLRYRTDNTFAIHLWNVSWGSPWAKFRDRLLYWIRWSHPK